MESLVLIEVPHTSNILLSAAAIWYDALTSYNMQTNDSMSGNKTCCSLLSNLWYKLHLSRQWKYWSLRCNQSIACQQCPNYIFILDLTPGFNRLGKDNCKTRRETFKFWDLVHLIFEVSQYVLVDIYEPHNPEFLHLVPIFMWGLSAYLGCARVYDIN